MQNSNIKNWIAAALLLLIIPVSGCSWFEEEEKVEVAESDPIVIGINYFPSALIFALAEDLGYYEDEGVNVEVVLYENYSDYWKAMELGEIEVIGLAFMDVFHAWDDGKKLKVVAVADYSYGADAIITRQGKGLDSLENLKGEKIAVEIGTVGDFLLDFALSARAKIDIGSIEKLNYTAKDAATAFINNEVDVAVTYEPYVYEILSNSDGQVIFDSRNERGLIPDVLLVEENNLKERREDYKKIIKAWFKAVDYLKNFPNEASEIIANRIGLSQEEYIIQLESLYILDLRDNITAFSIGSGFESLYGSGRLIIDFFESNEVLQKTPDINIILDDSIVRDLYNESHS